MKFLMRKAPGVLHHQHCSYYCLSDNWGSRHQTGNHQHRFRFRSFQNRIPHLRCYQTPHTHLSHLPCRYQAPDFLQALALRAAQKPA